MKQYCLVIDHIDFAQYYYMDSNNNLKVMYTWWEGHDPLVFKSKKEAMDFIEPYNLVCLEDISVVEERELKVAIAIRKLRGK